MGDANYGGATDFSWPSELESADVLKGEGVRLQKLIVWPLKLKKEGAYPLAGVQVVLSNGKESPIFHT